MSILEEYDSWVARASTTSDIFNAIAEAGRREILDVLMTGEKAVGAIVDDLSMSETQTRFTETGQEDNRRPTACGEVNLT